MKITPCTSECKLDALKTFCLGCKRTKSEIGEWSKYSDEQKLVIVRAVKTRTHILETDAGQTAQF